MAEKQYFRIRNFERFQHYKDRRPPWIKLYRDLWHDPRFFALSENVRYQIISLFVLASQNNNELPIDQAWLRHELATTKPIELNELFKNGWIEIMEQHASKTLAPRYQDAMLETETETEIQRQRKNPPFPLKKSNNELRQERINDKHRELRELARLHSANGNGTQSGNAEGADCALPEGPGGFKPS